MSLKIQTKNFDDNIYTSQELAKNIIGKFNLYGKVLDASMGGGAFFNQLPDHVEKDWCELDRNKDFFDYHKKVDWIITNPPFSKLTQFLEHAFKISDNVVYLIPAFKLFVSAKRLRLIREYTNVIELHEVKKPKDWTINFPLVAVYFKRKDS